MPKGNEELSLITLIIVGITVMLILALGIIFFVILYQRRVITHQQELEKIKAEKELELLRATIDSEEKERMRIAAELHDDVNSTLASARLFLYKEKNAIYREEAINQSKELLDESINKIRDISHKLQPAMLQRLGLDLSLQALQERLNKSGALKANHVAKQQLPRLPDYVELAAYRISQELIANILKHTGATQISTTTETSATGITITFSHDGIGMTQEEYEDKIYKKGATGLKNIVNRLKSINGIILFRMNDNSLFEATLHIPTNTK